jgi:hypothetical protein
MLHLLYICLMKFSKVAPKLDNIGMTASALCAVHCAVVPVLITALPLMGLGFLADPWVEWWMIILALVIGISSLSLSYLNTHRRILPLIMLAAGFGVIITGHLLITGWLEAVIVPCGGLTIAAAHFVNYKYAGVCKIDGMPFGSRHVH